MPPRLGVGWWKCCNCNREVNKAAHGEEKCPDCGFNKCERCTDPFDRPSDLADLTTAQSCWFGDLENADGLASCGGTQLVEDITANWAVELTEADMALEIESLVDSDLLSK